MRRTLYIVVALVIAGGIAIARDRSARAELADELATCAAFYSVGAAAGEAIGVKGAIVAEEPIITRSLQLSVEHGDFAKTKARYELALAAAQSTVAKEGLDRLTQQFGSSCKAAVENPETRLQQLRDR